MQAEGEDIIFIDRLACRDQLVDLSLDTLPRLFPGLIKVFRVFQAYERAEAIPRVRVGFGDRAGLRHSADDTTNVRWL